MQDWSIIRTSQNSSYHSEYIIMISSASYSLSLLLSRVQCILHVSIFIGTANHIMNVPIMRSEHNLLAIIDETDYMRELRLRLLSTFFFYVSWELDIGHNKRLDLIKLVRRVGRASRVVQMFANKSDRPPLNTRELIENSFSH